MVLQVLCLSGADPDLWDSDVIGVHQDSGGLALMNITRLLHIIKELVTEDTFEKSDSAMGISQLVRDLLLPYLIFPIMKELWVGTNGK